MAKINLENVAGGYNLSAINTNFDRIEKVVNEDLLSRNNTGGFPNEMRTDLDVNSHRVYNVPDPIEDHEAVNKGWVEDHIQGGPYQKNLRVTDVNIPAFPDAATRANKLMSFDAQGNPRVQFPASDSATQLRIDLLDPTQGSELIAYSENSSVKDRLDRYLNIKDYFGAVGDGYTDDTAAIVAGDLVCQMNKKILYFPIGVYVFRSSIDKYASWEGERAPVMGAFPNRQDDKVFMRQGQKGQIPASVLLFKGTATKTFTTVRSDQFSSFSYLIQNVGINSEDFTYYRPSVFKDLGVVLDFDLYEGATTTLTNPTNDNRAIADVGVVFNNNFGTKHENLTIFGYFAKSGAVLYGANPDYNVFKGSSFHGNIGMSIIGDGSNGLSGTTFEDTIFYSMDHHSRSLSPEEWGLACIYMDGPIGANGRISGIYFTDCRIRTHCNTPLIFGAVTNVSFTNLLTELTNYPGSTQSTTKQFVGTARTGNILFFGPRWTANQPIEAVGGLIETATGGNIIIVGSAGGTGIDIWNNGQGLKMYSTNNSSQINFTNAPRSNAMGYSFRKAPEGQFQILYNGSEIHSWGTDGGERSQIRRLSSTLTVSGGSITVVGSWHRLAGGVTDLTTIVGGIQGQQLLLNSAATSNTITLKDGTGNLRLAGDCILSNGQNYIMLHFDGTNWCELHRSMNS